MEEEGCELSSLSTSEHVSNKEDFISRARTHSGPRKIPAMFILSTLLALVSIYSLLCIAVLSNEPAALGDWSPPQTLNANINQRRMRGGCTQDQIHVLQTLVAILAQWVDLGANAVLRPNPTVHRINEENWRRFRDRTSLLFQEHFQHQLGQLFSMPSIFVMERFMSITRIRENDNIAMIECDNGRIPAICNPSIFIKVRPVSRQVVTVSSFHSPHFPKMDVSREASDLESNIVLISVSTLLSRSPPSAHIRQQRISSRSPTSSGTQGQGQPNQRLHHHTRASPNRKYGRRAEKRG